ncbi:hypothetical protein CTAYLR_008031 [Chrysophaeum taylorii]|uniref:RRM domain-containing protein n=1 Tax=Chrysophaeum taylorii TaxID=2483200 RepID=A0AAD7U714_9STRA|nr:hypothetical protein CTAYLR_008031 [Chrysophaeum taylorii]
MRRRRSEDSDESRRRRRRRSPSDDSRERRRRRKRRHYDDSPPPRRYDSEGESGGTRLYVGNIPYTMTTEQLRDHFSTMGRVVDCIVKADSATGRSRGFGIVQFQDPEDAAHAIDRWNNRSYESRPLVVRYDRDLKPPGGYASTPRGFDGSARPLRSLAGPPPNDRDLRRLLIDREKARVARDYRTADAIRSDLADRGITINDLTRTWASVDGRSGPRPSAYDDDTPRAVGDAPGFSDPPKPQPPEEQGEEREEQGEEREDDQDHVNNHSNSESAVHRRHRGDDDDDDDDDKNNEDAED